MGLCGGDKPCVVAQLWEVQPAGVLGLLEGCLQHTGTGCCGSVSSPTKCSSQMNSSVTG